MTKGLARVRLTSEKIRVFTCPASKSQAFLWDTDAPRLALRATPTGRKTYVFESRLNGATLRMPIGPVADWNIGQARAEARRLAVLVDAGHDPREIRRQQERERAAAQLERDAQAVTVGAAWDVYVEERRRHWGEAHWRDHIKAVRAGGEPAQRGTRGRGTTSAGPLHPLLALRLADLDTFTVERWAAREGADRPTQARLALRLLRAFLNWCSEYPDFQAAVPAINPANSRRAREALGRPQARRDVLQREQLPAWFAAVQAISNPAISAYLQCLLLTGARPGELLALRWEDVDWRWRGLTLHDKAESRGGADGFRVIPLSPYVGHSLAGLPRRGPFVFAGLVRNKPMSPPHHPHSKACAVAAIEGLTLHGLRRSFGTLSEWLELPAGVVAQLQGHKPSAIVERHYRVRPLDLLRVHHEKLERWILEQAGIVFDADKKPGKLRAV
jgi:integrase